MDEISALDHFKALLAVEEQKFLGMVARIDSVMDEREAQLRLTKESLDIRLENMNAARTQINRVEAEKLDIGRFEREHSFLTQKLEIERKALADRLDTLIKDKIDPLLISKAMAEGKASRAHWISIVAVIVSMIALAVHWPK